MSLVAPRFVPTGESVRRGELWAIVATCVLLALAVRVPLLAGSSFPLNDGGLFYTMSRELEAADFRPPAFTSYNGGTIPFAYPPLGLYLAAGLTKLTGATLPVLLRILPLAANLATVLVVVALSREMLAGAWAGLLSALLFPLLPGACDWLIMGGGLTRSFGLLFATLAAWACHRTVRRPARWNVGLLALFLALTVLSHPGAASFALLTPLVFWAVAGRRTHAAPGILVAYGVAAALTAPWWARVLAQHGPGPFLAAAASVGGGQSLATLSGLLLPAGQGAAVVGVLAVVGFFYEVAQRRWLIPGWLLVTAIVIPNLMAPVVAPMVAMLAGVALAEVVLPALSRSVPGTARGANGDGAAGGADGRSTSGAFTIAASRVGVVVAVLLNALIPLWNRSAFGLRAPPVLSRNEREAMAWVSRNTPPDSSFLVLSAADSWAEDPASEWFPALAQRRSVATPQGFEWVGGGAYARRGALYEGVKGCLARDEECLEGFRARAGSRFDHLYISKATTGPFNPAPLWHSVVRSGRFDLLLDGPDASVFRYRGR